jgi:DNA-binding MarR family transcriptional regulator
MITDEKEYEILKLIHRKKEQVRQRDIAEIAGVSLGTANLILHQLSQKGWLTMMRLSNRKILYALTPAGVEEVMRRSYRYFKKTVRNVVVYKEAIERIVKDVKKNGFTRISLIGNSDLDFIVAHACQVYHVDLVKEDDGSRADGVFYLYSEGYLPDHELNSRDNSLFLQELFL